MAEGLKKGAATMELVKQAPILCIFGLFAVGFLYFMERRDEHWIRMLERDDLQANQRIEQCHLVQHESASAMKAVAAALQSQMLTFRELSIRIEHQQN